MRTTALIIIALLFIASFTEAAQLWKDEDSVRLLSLDTSIKISNLASRNPNDQVLYSNTWTNIMLLRIRYGLNFRFSDRVAAELAYEQSARWTSDIGAGTAGRGVLPSTAPAPYRITQLYDTMFEQDRRVGYHELDRALLAFHPDWGEVVIGRQAIGLGRGVMFSAVDMFAPFSPLEVDREWRRGVDAARLDYRLSATTSAEIIAVFGEDWDSSAIVARLRGYLGDADGELLLGKRARDEFVAAVISSAVGDAEIHGEAAFFHTPEQQPDGGFANDNLVLKAVLGSSYTFDVGNGLTILGEYHYSAFGVRDSDEINRQILLNPSFQERFLRGDMQILTRHQLGLQASYPLNDVLTGTFLVLQNPRDGSGTTSPTLRWDFSRSTTFLISAYFPWGEGSDNGQLKSEHGASPISLFTQLAFYF